MNKRIKARLSPKNEQLTANRVFMVDWFKIQVCFKQAITEGLNLLKIFFADANYLVLKNKLLRY